MTTSAPRSPQAYRPTGSSTSSSDEILPIFTSIPQRPRQHRQIPEAPSSPVMSASQFYQHFQQQQQQQQQHQDPYYSSSIHSHSPRPSPRSTPNTFGGYQSGGSLPPPSPVTFQLPPSAFSPRDDSLRSGSISLQSPQPLYVNPSPSVRSPHVSPGLPSSGSLSALPPPLTLPESFLEDQSDYAGYYATEGGILSSPQFSPSPQQYHLQTPPVHSGPISTRQYYASSEVPPTPTRQNSRGFLPSPHMTPAASPNELDFPSLSLNGK
jgi:hypothetical protein